MESISIGLDIGSSAVRAAEIELKDHQKILRRYAQVGLPAGWVVDGEIVNGPGVASALRRLWAEGGFTTTKVVLGVSGPRVFIRQADVPAMNTEDLRSSLKFDAQELIPIPMDNASFDFSVLEQGIADDDGNSKARVLIVAAQRQVLRNQLHAVKDAGLRAHVVDASPLALLRAMPSASADASNVEILVSIGADLTTVAVREGNVPRFIRVLTVGGSQLTQAISNTMHIDAAQAERLKRATVDGDHVAQLTQAKKVMSDPIRDLAEDIRATMDFFSNQGGSAEVTRVLLTGGASLTDGLASYIGKSAPIPVEQINPFSALSFSPHLGLSESHLEIAASSAATAIGLALWPFESPLIRLSVLPDEVAAAHRARRAMTFAACGLAGMVTLLGIGAAGEALAVKHARVQVQASETRVAAAKSEVASLERKTAPHGETDTRAHLVIESLQGDIDWVRLLGQLASVMPSGLTLSTFSGSRGAAATAGSPSSSTTVTNPGVGTVTFSVQGPGNLTSVADWLAGVQKDDSLQGTWVQGITVSANGGQVSVSFSSTSNITPNAQSSRAAAVKL
jgi:type IV pilus assembly protein PilM